MKLNIQKNETTKGIIFKKKIYEMRVSCELTPEELESYKSVENEIQHMIIAEREIDGMELNFRVGDLIYTFTHPKLKGSRFELSAQHEMPELEQTIKENAKALANYLKKVQEGGELGEEIIDL